MYSLTSFGYKQRPIFDLKFLIVALRFAINNVILAFIFLFLTLEELDWSIFSFRKKIKDIVIDHTSWSINTIF